MQTIDLLIDAVSLVGVLMVAAAVLWVIFSNRSIREMTEPGLIREAAKRFMRFEGYVRNVYKCPAGYYTAGYGRNLETVGLSRDEAEMLAFNDIAKATEQAAKYSWFILLNDARRLVIIDMIANMGAAGFATFRRTIAALEIGDYLTAADEMQNSAWFKQVGARARENVEIMRTGELPNE